jgi:hypothetical protein
MGVCVEITSKLQAPGELTCKDRGHRMGSLVVYYAYFVISTAQTRTRTCFWIGRDREESSTCMLLYETYCIVWR